MPILLDQESQQNGKICSDRFKIKGWKVTILYNTTCQDIDTIIEALTDINCSDEYINEALDNLETCNLNIGLTYSNMKLKSSVIVIGKTNSNAQLINTIAHEFFHLIYHISGTLGIVDEEELANLNGNLNMRAYKFIESRL